MAVDRQKVIQNAEKLVARGRLDAAIGEYRKVLSESPDDTNTLNRLGDLYARLDRIDKAIELFNRTARHFSREGFFVKAIAIYKKIIRLDPAQIEVYESLAALYHRQGLINEARSQYQVVADYYEKHDRHGEAAGVYRRLIDLEPENPTHRLGLAELLQREGKTSEAMDQYREIASLMLMHGRVDEATRVFLSSLEVDAQDLGFITDAVLELKSGGHRKAAQRVLLAAIERNPAAGGLAKLAGLEPDQEAPVAEAAEKATPATPPRAGRRQPPPASEIDGEDILVLDLDEEELTADYASPPLDALPETKPAPAAPPEAAPPARAAEAPGAAAEPELDVEIELEEAESAPAAAAPPAPPEDTRLAELLSEAEVLAKFGLEEKALERLEEGLAAAPGDLRVHRQLLDLHLALGRTERAGELAAQAAEEAARSGALEEWREIEESLADRGLTSTAEPEVAPEVEAALEIELTEAEAALEIEPTEAEAALEIEPTEAEPALEIEPTEAEPALEIEATEAEAAAAEGVEPELSIEIETDTEAAEDDEGALAWLAEKREAEGAEAGETLFDAEEEFFDLASELEEELRKEEEKLGEVIIPQLQEQTLEEIVEGFKKGMAETLSAEDYDTHYNLGIAYREMGLVDEAIGEFQLASKDPRYLVDCCSLLATCFLEKGFPELAVKWYRRGLDSPTLSETEMLGLLYELGNLHFSMGQVSQARDRFVEIYGVNSNYRDIVAKLEEVDRSSE